MKKRVILLLVYVLLMGAQVSFAQELPELSEQYTSDDGRLIVHYPADWVVLDETETLILTHKSAVKAVRDGNPIPNSYFAATLVLPTQLSQVGLTATSSAEDVVERFIELSRFDGDTEIEPYNSIGVPGASAMVSNLDVRFGQLIALEFDTGTVFVAIEYANDYPDFEAEYANVLAYGLSGLVYDGQSAANGSIGAETTAPTSSTELVRQWAMFATGSSQFGESGWGFVQATGAPNTETCGDTSTAWASSSSRGVDNLTLGFRQAVIPTQVNIYQTFTPGSIIGIELINTETGDTIQIPDSADPPGNTPCPGVFTLNIEDIRTPVNGVVIYFDQRIGGSWNEIDAVELIGEVVPTTVTEDIRQWANYATGTSQYGEVGWGFMQATGAPDTDTCGDSLQAWASSGSTTSEILALEFEQTVIPTQVNIYQTYNPGSIIRIELTNTDTGEVIPVPDSADPPGNTPCPGVFTVNVSGVETPVNGVIIYFDQSIGGSWNEIDAVELVGTAAGSGTGDSSSTLAPDVDSGEAANSSGEWEVTESFSHHGDKTLSLYYPAGWITDTSALPAIASSKEALSALQRGTPMPEGEIAIGIIPAADVTDVLGIPSSDSVEEMITSLAGVFGGETEIAPFEGLRYPAYYTPLVGTTRLPENSHLLSFEHSNGVVTFLVVTDNFDAYIPLLAEIVESISIN